MSVRAARVEDLEAMLAIARGAFGTSAWTREQFESGLKPAKAGLQRWLLVGEAEEAEGGACVGYLAMSLAWSEAEVQSLAVEPAWRGRGVGGELLRAGLHQALERGAERVFLEVRAGNVLAREFYRRRGFAEFARRPGYYHHPEEAAVLMRWQVHNSG